MPVLEAILSDIDLDRLKTDVTELFDTFEDKRILSHLWNENATSIYKSNYGYSSFNAEHGNLINVEKFNWFYEQLGSIVDEFFAQLGYRGTWEYANSWAAVYPKGSYIARHNHGNVHWSGVFYVNVPDLQSKIVFDDPKEYSLTNEPEGFTHRGAVMAAFDPVPGKLLMWPGYVKHYSIPNMADEDRIIISFNINCHE